MRNILRVDKFLIATFALFGFIFWHLAKEMLQVRPDGWYAGHINLWGDLAFHLSLINKFQESDKFLPDNPIFAGDKINYPIFADWITAQIARIVGIDFALFITTSLAGILLIAVAIIFVKIFIKKSSVVFLSLMFFFLNGGFGFYYFFRDLFYSQQNFLIFITHLPRQYTDLKDQGYWWINNYLAYLLPQRGFLIAIPVTLVIFSLLYLGQTRNKTKFFILAGFLSGALPLIQAHSLLAVFLVSACFFGFMLPSSVFRKDFLKNWLSFAVITILVAFPLFKTISTQGNPLEFIRFEPGWTSNENIFWFWFKNLGIFGPLLVISAVWLLIKNRHLFNLYVPFAIIFLLSNLFVFQPWDFDNSKLLLYWYFASSIVVAYFLHDQFFSGGFLRRILGSILVFFLTLSGLIDIFRTFTPVTNYQMFSKKDLMLASEIKTLTPKDVVFVTASNHNHPIPVLTGRSTLLGYPGWLWSHGINYYQREADISQVYSGTEQADNIIKKYKVSYVTVGPNETASFNVNANYFEKFPGINLGYDWQIYNVSNLWSDGER